LGRLILLLRVASAFPEGEERRSSQQDRSSQEHIPLPLATALLCWFSRPLSGQGRKDLHQVPFLPKHRWPWSRTPRRRTLFVGTGWIWRPFAPRRSTYVPCG